MPDLSDFKDSISLSQNLLRPTFEDIGTASARRSEHLFPWEDHWMRLHPWLETQGYRLRSRFRPDWVPSWLAAKVSPFGASDHYSAKSGWIDAIRIEDNATVTTGQILLHLLRRLFHLSVVLRAQRTSPSQSSPRGFHTTRSPSTSECSATSSGIPGASNCPLAALSFNGTNHYSS